MHESHYLLKELCKEVLNGDIESEAFNRLWLLSGINLDSCELEIAHRILQRAENISGHPAPRLPQ